MAPYQAKISLRITCNISGLALAQLVRSDKHQNKVMNFTEKFKKQALLIKQETSRLAVL